MIFVSIGWTFLLFTTILVRVWMQSPSIHSSWSRVRTMSAALLGASSFFLFLHFASPQREKEMQNNLFKTYSLQRDDLLSKHSHYKTRNESRSQNSSAENATYLSPLPPTSVQPPVQPNSVPPPLPPNSEVAISPSNSIINDITQGRLGK